MDSFKELFKQLCQKYKVFRQDFILDYLKSVENDRISLDLSSCNLSVSICIILGKVLEQDTTVTDLHFCNCMLPYKGLKVILDGLCVNKAVRLLNLKGNNLRGKNAEDIGKLLRDNNVLYCLSLEWNSLGKCHDSFTLLCSGLATNKTLKILDLRNNEINDEGAVALASALAKNISLQSLDVRWNRINNLGADSLLNVLKQYNKTLLNLDLSGNPEIANSILETIASVLTNNCTLQLLEEDELRRKKIMMDKLRATNISVQNVKQDVTFLSSNLEKDFQWKNKIENIRRLEKELHEKKLAFDCMIERVHKLQENLEESNGKLEESNKLLTEIKEENLKLKEEHQEELHKATKLRLDSVSEVVSKMDAIKEENRYLQLQLDSSLKTQELQSKKIGKLQDDVKSLEEQIKHLEIAHEEQIETMKEEQKELIKEMKYLRQQETLKIKTEMEEKEKSLNENLSKFEEEKSQLKQEIIKLNGKLLEEKTKTEDLLQEQRLELHKDMNEQCSHLSVKLHTLQKENDNRVKIISQQKFEIAQLQSTKEYLQVENDNQSKLIEQLKEQIASKDAELRRLITNYEEENKERHKELMKEKENQKNLHNKINYLETENVTMEGLQQKLSNAIKRKDCELQGLKEKLEQKEVELRQLQKHEIQRTAQLYSAFKNFVSNTPHSDIKDNFVSDETNTSLSNA